MNDLIKECIKELKSLFSDSFFNLWDFIFIYTISYKSTPNLKVISLNTILKNIIYTIINIGNNFYLVKPLWIWLIISMFSLRVLIDFIRFNMHNLYFLNYTRIIKVTYFIIHDFWILYYSLLVIFGLNFYRKNRVLNYINNCSNKSLFVLNIVILTFAFCQYIFSNKFNNK